MHKCEHPITHYSPQKHMPSSQTCTQSHPVHPHPSCSSQCAWTVLLVGARGIQMSVHTSSLCFCDQDLMVYLHPAAAHESHRLHIHWPASLGNDELCLACSVTKAMKIYQLLFQTVDHKCVGSILTFVEIWRQDC